MRLAIITPFGLHENLYLKGLSVNSGAECSADRIESGYFATFGMNVINNPHCRHMVYPQVKANLVQQYNPFFLSLPVRLSISSFTYDVDTIGFPCFRQALATDGWKV
ncbi:MAG: hypothetical protein R2744_07750 [Bacteroidales bacterium]